MISFTNAASVVPSYNKNGDTDGILAITGISQESSWRCRGDTATLCACPTKLILGKIAKVEYRRSSAVAEAFVIENARGGEYIFMGNDWDSDLGTASSSWVPRLIRVGAQVLVVADMCGASGRNVIAREIYSTQMLK